MPTRASGENEPVARKPTLRDVSALARVSRMTVTRTLLRPDQVSPETRDRVEGAIATLGYVPDRAAGSLSTRRSGFIGLILPTLSNGNFAAMAEGLTDAIRPDGFELLIGHTRYGIDEDERQIRTILQRRPEALILTATTHAASVRRLVANAAIPIIEIADLPAEPIGQVIGFSNHDVGVAAARHLLSLGHRRVAALGPERTSTRIDTRGEARLDGFAMALREAGLSTALVRAAAEIPVSFEQGARAMASLLADAPDVTAVFAISDLLAVGAMMECHRRGVAIPAALSLIGFGDFEIGRQVLPPLTTIGVDFRSLGEDAGRMVTALLSKGIAIPDRSDVGFRLIERRTTARRS
jgi:LacI family gluconate utilization system Gnt-I transcriptional repressor